MSLMSSLYVGTSGLRTGQNALNTTAHNLSNMDTAGYVRQQVQQSSKSYLTLSIDVKSVANKQTGLGVDYARVKHIRDHFLDKIYRRESGRSMFYQVSTEVMEEVESQLPQEEGISQGEGLTGEGAEEPETEPETKVYETDEYIEPVAEGGGGEEDPEGESGEGTEGESTAGEGERPAGGGSTEGERPAGGGSTGGERPAGGGSTEGERPAGRDPAG